MKQTNETDNVCAQLQKKRNRETTKEIPNEMK